MKISFGENHAYFDVPEVNFPTDFPYEYTEMVKFYGIATPSQLSITHMWWGCKGAGRSKNLFICNFLAAPQISTQNLGIENKKTSPSSL